MMQMNLKQARRRLGELVRTAAAGESVVITRRGKKVACIAPLQKKLVSLPDLKSFRASIKVSGKRLSETVRDNRAKERY